MNKLSTAIFALTCTLLACTNVSAQYKSKSRFNFVVQPGYQVPTGTMSTYYSGGWGGEVKVVASISKRQSFFRLSAIASSQYYKIGGKTYSVYSSGLGMHTDYRSDPFSVTTIHGGLRIDMGFNKELPIGMYFSQDYGLTYISGSTGGSRLGNTFNLGVLLVKVDLAMGYNSWVRPTGTKFHFFTIGLGWIF